ncbi:integrase [Mycobacterium avium subsp. hominissuis]|nr:integrase [Mycobacterium avium subsp. hominissuis]
MNKSSGALTQHAPNSFEGLHIKRIFSPHNLRVNHRVGVAIPPLWDNAINGWATWLRVAGRREGTIAIRQDHVRSIARRSGTQHPREVTLNCLVTLCSERRWSLEYRKGMRASLVSFYEWAVANGVVEQNPAVLLPRVKAPTPAPRPAPDDIWSALLAAAPARVRLMARLAGEAGLRRAEVAAVHSDDLIQDLHGWSLIVHGKGGKQRVVPLTDALAAELRQQLIRHGYLFPGQIDGHISPRWVGKMISDLMPPGWTMHKLRHRYASRGYAQTRDIRAVQEALGHASVATTQRYTAVSSADVRAVSEAAAWRNE